MESLLEILLILAIHSIIHHGAANIKLEELKLKDLPKSRSQINKTLVRIDHSSEVQVGEGRTAIPGKTDHFSEDFVTFPDQAE